MNLPNTWTPAEYDSLRELYTTGTKEVMMAAVPNRTWRAIHQQACKLGLQRPYQWTRKEIALLRKLYGNSSKEVLTAALPNRTWGAILARGQARGLARTTRAWPVADEEILRQYYPKEGAQKLAARLGRTVDSVAHRASSMGLRIIRVARLPRSRAFIGPRLPKAVKTLKPAKIKEAKPRKFLLPKMETAQPKARVNPAIVPPKKPAVPLLAVKRSAGTPNLNLQKENRKKQELAAKKTAPISAEEIRKLPYNHPGRMAYSLNGQAGWMQWQAQQSA